MKIFVGIRHALIHGPGKCALKRSQEYHNVYALQYCCAENARLVIESVRMRKSFVMCKKASTLKISEHWQVFWKSKDV